MARARLRGVVHPSAWKGNSANFALKEFSEVHYFGDAPRIQRYI